MQPAVSVPLPDPSTLEHLPVGLTGSAAAAEVLVPNFTIPAGFNLSPPAPYNGVPSFAKIPNIFGNLGATLGRRLLADKSPTSAVRSFVHKKLLPLFTLAPEEDWQASTCS